MSAVIIDRRNRTSSPRASVGSPQPPVYLHHRLGYRMVNRMLTLMIGGWLEPNTRPGSRSSRLVLIEWRLPVCIAPKRVGANGS
jgi:hypothetical protein